MNKKYNAKDVVEALRGLKFVTDSSRRHMVATFTLEDFPALAEDKTSSFILWKEQKHINATSSPTEDGKVKLTITSGGHDHLQNVLSKKTAPVLLNHFKGNPEDPENPILLNVENSSQAQFLVAAIPPGGKGLAGAYFTDDKDDTIEDIKKSYVSSITIINIKDCVENLEALANVYTAFNEHAEAQRPKVGHPNLYKKAAEIFEAVGNTAAKIQQSGTDVGYTVLTSIFNYHLRELSRDPEGYDPKQAAENSSLNRVNKSSGVYGIS